MSGSFTASLSNAAQAVEGLSTIAGLPSTGIDIRNTMVAAITPVIDEAPKLQKSILDFSGNSIPELEQIIRDLDNGADPTSEKTKLLTLAQQFSALKSQSGSLHQMVINATNTISGQSTAIAQTEQQLRSQIANLDGEIAAAKAQRDAAQKKYYWLLALGPFGLIGLSVALGLYLKWKGDVDALGQQINALSAQIIPFQAMLHASATLGTASSGLINVIGQLDSAVDAVSSDMGEIIANLSSPDDLKLFITATIGMIRTLEADAA